MNLFKRKKQIRPLENHPPLSEDDYYSRLFISNPSWNKVEPNGDEQIRWNAIEKFIFYLRGFKKANGENSNLNILDLGCGRGWMVNLLSSHGNAQGIEPVKAVADFGSDLFPHLKIEAGTSKDLIQRGDKEKYHLVVCSEVIEHILDENKVDFVADVKTLLKDQGFLIITTPRKDIQDEWMKYSKPGQPVEDWIDEKSLQNLLEGQGFITHLLERCLMKPKKDAPELEIYQVWLFQKSSL